MKSSGGVKNETGSGHIVSAVVALIVASPLGTSGHF